MKKKFVIFLLALIMPFAFVSATDDLLTSMPNRTDDVIFEDVPNDEVTKETYNGTKFSADFNVSSTDNVDGIDANDTGVVVMAGNIILVKMDKNGQIYQFYKYQLSNLTAEKLAEI